METRENLDEETLQSTASQSVTRFEEKNSPAVLRDLKY